MLRVLALVVVTACSFQRGTASNGNGEAGISGEAGLGSDAGAGSPDAKHYLDAHFLDAHEPACDATLCTGAGGSCGNTGICTIHVSNTDAVLCPTGQTCQIECDSMEACKNGIDCTAAASCEIDCNMMNACDGDTLACGNSTCTLYCRAGNTCGNMIMACGHDCDLECCAMNACGTNTVIGGGTFTQGTTCPPPAP